MTTTGRAEAQARGEIKRLRAQMKRPGISAEFRAACLRRIETLEHKPLGGPSWVDKVMS